MILRKFHALFLITALLTGLLTQCQTEREARRPAFETVKVDFDFAQRRVEEVNDPHYHSWPIEEGTEAQKTFGETRVTLRGNFSSGWYKVGVHAPHYAQLVSDGLVTAQPLEMTIAGLPSGTHSLLTFHNTFDNPETGTFAPIQIYVNGKQVETVTPTNRATSTIESGMTYFTFDVPEGDSVRIRFVADSTAEATRSELVLNGFELDGANRMLQARHPQPINGDQHVVTENDFQLRWESPKGIQKHHLYVGTDEAAVRNAGPDAEEYQGELTGNAHPLRDLYSRNLYYWRVDEVDGNGEVTEGEVWSFRPAQLAFPGAEGYGRFALGGRGGKVVEVTNLNDSGPGSLREAVTNDIGPRTIVFNVAGTIELKSRLVVNQPYITIAGQTAPGKGITITRAPIGLTGDDGVIRFLRVRIGAGRTFDGMGLTGANHSIIDHCSISWTLDESFSSRGAHNITLQRTLISEALNVAGHSKYEAGKMHGYAATIGGDVGSFHHNLLAHNYGRNWSIGGGLNGDGYYTGKLDIRNNVVYNWGHRATDGGANEVNFVNNYYKPGPSTDFFYALNAQHEGVGLGKQQYYFDGNVMTGHFDEQNQEAGRKATTTNQEVVEYETFVDAPFFESHVTTQPAWQAYKDVLSDIGANRPLDQHDQRIIQETLDSTYAYKGSKSGLAGMIDTEQDVGGLEEYPEESRPADWDSDHDGLPDWWETAKGLNPNSARGDFTDTNLDEDRDGFTQLDDYLDWMAQPHYFVKTGESLSIPVAPLFRGFTEGPSYSITKGEATLNNGTITVPTSQKGLHSVAVTVEDASGDAMTRTVQVLVQ
ncbi:polysaccharide lyase family 1 protein [Catalinimonas alkaloidigena]